jgi:hypothetical protein
VVKVTQTITTPGNGNCFAACVASILECDLDRLPNPHGDNWFGQWHEFLKPHGLRMLGKNNSLYYWESYWIGLVDSLNNEGRGHAVVMLDDSLAHDPNEGLPDSKVYEQVSYKQCYDGYGLILSDAGLFRRSNLYA